MVGGVGKKMDDTKTHTQPNYTPFHIPIAFPFD